jgi:membrane-associated PAP2 superfamily phosphatase
MAYSPLPTRGVLLWLAWAMALSATLLWDATPFDRWVMQALSGPHGFELMHHPILENWFHTRMRQLSLLILAGLWGLAVWPKSLWRRPLPERLLLVGLVTLNVVAINVLKQGSATSCPWDVGLWGGNANYVSHWNWIRGDGGPGRCFPGGHVLSALAFMPLVMAAWWPINHTTYSKFRAQMYTVLVGGGTLLAGVTQTVRGAHYPSHTAWSAVICFGLGLLGWTLWQWRHGSSLVHSDT